MRSQSNLLLKLQSLVFLSLSFESSETVIKSTPYYSYQRQFYFSPFLKDLSKFSIKLNVSLSFNVLSYRLHYITHSLVLYIFYKGSKKSHDLIKISHLRITSLMSSETGILLIFTFAFWSLQRYINRKWIWRFISLLFESLFFTVSVIQL